MGLSKPVIITSSAVDTSNLATKSDMTTLQNSVTSALSGVGGAVKKIQFGTGVLSSDTSEEIITLSGFTDVNKMAVLINGSRRCNGSNPQYIAAAYLDTLSLNSLKIKCTGTNSNASYCYYSYQVIEYY